MACLLLSLHVGLKWKVIYGGVEECREEEMEAGYLGSNLAL